MKQPTGVLYLKVTKATHFWVAIEFLYQDRAGDRAEGGGICIKYVENIGKYKYKMMKICIKYVENSENM